jgi:hypothetical protein
MLDDQLERGGGPSARDHSEFEYSRRANRSVLGLRMLRVAS